MKSFHKRIYLASLLIIFIFGTQVKLFAQFNACKDTLNTNTVFCSYQQDTMWQPVCGCDQHTYSNLCTFDQAHLLNYTPRACEEVSIPHLYPNPASDQINYRIYLKQQEDAFVYIYDDFGRAHYYHFFENILDDTETLEVSNLLSHGVYMMIVVANGHFAYKKFVKD